MADKGGTAIVIGLGRPHGMPMGKSKSTMDEGDDENGSATAEDDAFQAAADAAKNGDGAAFKEAMKSAMELCYPQLAKGGYSEGSGDEEP